MAKQRTKKKTQKFEVTCVHCRFTKEWTQAQFDRHMRKVHNFKNERHIGHENTGAPQLAL